VPPRLPRYGRLITRYQQEGRLRPGEPMLAVGALLGPVIINTMLRVSAAGLPIPPFDVEAHVDHFLHGYAC